MLSDVTKRKINNNVRTTCLGSIARKRDVIRGNVENALLSNYDELRYILRFKVRQEH